MFGRHSFIITQFNLIINLFVCVFFCVLHLTRWRMHEWGGSNDGGVEGQTMKWICPWKMFVNLRTIIVNTKAGWITVNVNRARLICVNGSPFSWLPLRLLFVFFLFLFILSKTWNQRFHNRHRRPPPPTQHPIHPLLCLLNFKAPPRTY